MTQKKNFKETNVGIAKKANPSFPAGRYEKPLFIEKQELTFPKEIWEKFNGGRFCIQCSGCHGCR